MMPCWPRNFFSSFWWILSARSDGETLAVTEAVAGAEGVGDGDGVCADKPMASAIEQVPTIINLFIAVLSTWDALNVLFGFNYSNIPLCGAIKKVASRRPMDIISSLSKRGCSSVVEHLLAKEDVASSSLVTRCPRTKPSRPKPQNRFVQDAHGCRILHHENHVALPLVVRRARRHVFLFRFGCERG